MPKTKVFLKFNRSDPASVLCLRSWLEVFRDYQTVILCDLYTVNQDPVPDYLRTVLTDYSVQVINSDYALGNEYGRNLKGAKRGMASANLTCFQHLDGFQDFWIIDADDTMFLTRDFVGLRTKFSQAEAIAREQNLDGFSLDFYRNLNNGWTFGVALLRATMPWQLIKDVDMAPYSERGFARNIDTAFAALGEQGKISLKNFVFDRFAFQHQINNYELMPHGIYVWSKGCLWDQPLQSDVVVI